MLNRKTQQRSSQAVLGPSGALFVDDPGPVSRGRRRRSSTSLVIQETSAQKEVRRHRKTPGGKRLDWLANEAEKHPAALVPAERSFRHDGWKARRAAVRKAMIAGGVPAARMERFDCCGSDAWLYRSPSTGQVKVRASYCKDRFCLPCARARAEKYARLVSSLAKSDRTRMGNVTLSHSDLPLAKQLKNLQEAFRKMQRMDGWRRCVKGGAKTVEVTLNEKAGQWHPHIHFLWHGRYMPVEDLREMWRKASGGSFIVHVCDAQSEHEVSKYVTKYVCKGLSSSSLADPDRAGECVNALRGVRLFELFGTWRNHGGINLDPVVSDWERVGRLEDVVRAAKRGEPGAVALMRCLSPGRDVNSIDSG